jgi:N-acetylated-alpha-linked acidic dipeptidase
MLFDRILAAAAIFASLSTGIVARGFTPAQLAAEAGYEATVAASPSEAQARLDELGLAGYVHRMGTPGDLRTAKYVQRELAKAGWDAKLVTYVVPIAWPVEQHLTILGAHPQEVSLYEPTIPSDPYSKDHASIGIPYSGYSVDGDVTGPLVYANHATPADFAALEAAGVSVKGAIVVSRSGGGTLAGRAFEAAKRGAKAVLIFNDPLTSGYFMGETYPKGPWRPLGAATRNTMTFTNDPGDPTAIGIPVPGAPHKPFSAMRLPSIPEAPITGEVARTLLAAMGGPVGTSDWHPGFAFPLHLGGDVRAHFVLKSKRFFGPIWDVIGTLPGTSDDGMVVVGGHRDAWTYGAVDPISGTVDLLQLARAFGKLKASGWRPQRTVVIGSWDGEELNLFGSDEWVEQNAAELRAKCVAYINTDEVAFGPDLYTYATPDLKGLLRDASTAVNAPGGKLLSDYWQAKDPARTTYPIGGGSDHEPFVYHENLPAAGAGFGGPFGTYHSAYDDPASLAVFDPGMHFAAAAARYTSILVLRLADATIPDVRLSALAGSLHDRLADFAKGKGDEARRASVTATLQPALDAFVTASTALDARADAALQAGDTAGATKAYAELRAAEAAFYQPSVATWNRSLLYEVSGYDSVVLPSLDATLAKDGDTSVAILQAALNAATAAASGSGAPAPGAPAPGAPASGAPAPAAPASGAPAPSAPPATH